jgi:hypothetical protein
VQARLAEVSLLLYIQLIIGNLACKGGSAVSAIAYVATAVLGVAMSTVAACMTCSCRYPWLQQLTALLLLL